jgi:hypothetical protein
MDQDIKAIVDRYPNLRLQINLGNRHRIIHRRITRGSLWVYPLRSGAYTIAVNGEVKSIIIDMMNKHVLPEIGMSYDDYEAKRKALLIPNITEMANIIRRLGE